MIHDICLVLLGAGLLGFWQFIHDRGHAVFGVKNAEVQSIVTNVVTRYTGLWPLHMIDSGPTHQQVYIGGTVMAWFSNVPGVAGLPKNVRSFVVWGARRRREAAERLVFDLEMMRHGVEPEINQPLPNFPDNTFLLVTCDDAFIDCGIAFRPHWIVMMFLQATAPMHEGI